MDAVTFIRHATTQAHQRLLATLDGLDEDTLVWRPAPQANAIIEIAFHVARADDRLGRLRTRLGPEVWASQGWESRFGRSGDERRAGHYQFLKSGEATPALATIVEYLSAIHADTQQRLARLHPDDLERVPDPGRPQWTIAACFRHMITHKNNHHGQIDFIRGLRQPGWDLPPGTGVEQK